MDAYGRVAVRMEQTQNLWMIDRMGQCILFEHME